VNVGPFGEAELARISAAVARAEQSTSGEIVAYLVGECDAYPEARWRAAAIGGLLGLLAAVALRELVDPWGGSLLLWALAPALLGAAAGTVLGSVPAIRRRLIAPSTLERRVALRAESAFLEEEVFATRDRSGILVFLALFERRALVIGDAGVRAAVEAEAWRDVVDGLVAGVRAGRPVDALVEAVEACGRLLEQRGVTVRGDDADELADAPRFRQD
jgi:putative membrane protein